MNPDAVNINLNGKDITIPQAWSQCTPAIALRLCEHLNDASQAFSVEELNDTEKLFAYKLLLTTELIGVNMEFINRYSHQEKEQFIGKITQLMSLTNWLFVPITNDADEDTGKIKINVGMTNIKDILHMIRIPIKKGSKRSLVGPDNNGANLCFGEFIEADEAFQVYCKAKSERIKLAAMTNIAATLFREEMPFRQGLNTAHDKRVPFQSNFARYSINQRYEWIEAIELQQRKKLLHVVLFFWASYRERIMRKYPLCFTPSDNAKPHPYGWDAVIDGLCDSITEYDNVKGKPVDDVFKTLSLKEYNRQQQELAAL